MSNLDDLQKWLFQALKRELLFQHPQLMNTSLPDDLEGAQLPGRPASPFPPLARWNSLIDLTLSIRLGLQELRFVTDSLLETESGIGVWFFQSMEPLVAHSCLERLQRFVKLLSRGKRPIVASQLAKELDADIEIHLQRLRQLRDQAGHGPDIGTDGWLKEPSRFRLWELMALSDEYGGDVLDGFHVENLSSRHKYHGVIKPFVQHVQEVTEATAGILSAAREYYSPG